MSEIYLFKCPKCGAVSYNKHDLEEGYCGACHDWTAPPYGIVWPFVRTGAANPPATQAGDQSRPEDAPGIR